jgi:hypothetical protein
MDSETPPLHDLPHLRDRVTVEGHEGIFIVIACNSSLREADLAGTSQPGYLFGIPLNKLRPVSNLPADQADSHPDTSDLSDPRLLRLTRLV